MLFFSFPCYKVVEKIDRKSGVKTRVRGLAREGEGDEGHVCTMVCEGVTEGETGVHRCVSASF